MKSLVLGLVAAALAAFSAVSANGQEITGAGSTFAYPVISEWSRAYERAKVESDYRAGNAGLDSPPPGAALDYEPVGSLAGLMRVQNGDVDFAASDMPLKSEELAKLGLGQFPIVIGGVVAAVNLDGIGPGEIKFTGQLLADIFLGTVQNWSDPAIQALNPDIKLPDAKIAVVHRSDGSGTTFNFADYLSKVSPAWKEKMGADTLLRWPTGIGAKGNSGVALAIKQTKNSIGYVEFAQAMQAQLSYGLVQNRAGKFVKPEPASFQSAAATADWTSASDFHLLLTDAPGDDAYPIAATVFVLMRKQSAWLQQPEAVLNFFKWSLERGAKDAAGLGYVPLPDVLVKQVEDYWAKTFKTGA
jgi:phosphate transport system substrate-binding protein